MNKEAAVIVTGSAREVIEALDCDETTTVFAGETWVTVCRAGTSVITCIGEVLTMHGHDDEDEANDCYARVARTLTMRSLRDQASAGNPFPLFAAMDAIEFGE